MQTYTISPSPEGSGLSSWKDGDTEFRLGDRFAFFTISVKLRHDIIFINQVEYPIFEKTLGDCFNCIVMKGYL